MKTRPFVITTAVGIGIQILYFVISAIGGLVFYQEFFRNFDPNVPPDFGGNSSFPVLLLISGVALLAGPLLSIGLGVLYAFLHRREETSVSPESGVMGGAAAAATTRFVSGLFGILVSIFFSTFIFREVLVGTGDFGQVTPFPILAFSTVFSALSGLFGACFSAVIGGALGALGGGITGALLNR